MADESGIRHQVQSPSRGVGNALIRSLRDEFRAAAPKFSGLKLVLISGPSGSGKSTLVQQIYSGSVATDIREALPQSIAEWPLFAAHEFYKRGTDIPGWHRRMTAAGGAVLHYDIVFIRRYPDLDFANDPIFQLFEQASEVTVVCLRIAPQKLLTQFQQRAAEHDRRKGPLHRLWRRHVRTPLRRATAHLGRGAPPTTAESYADLDWLPGYYNEWERFVRDWIRGKPGSRLILAEPNVDSEEGLTFRLLPSATE